MQRQAGDPVSICDLDSVRPIPQRGLIEEVEERRVGCADGRESEHGQEPESVEPALAADLPLPFRQLSTEPPTTVSYEPRRHGGH